MTLQEKRQGTNQLSNLWRMIRQSFREIKGKDPMRMAGATAFFTTFALPPIFIILFQLFSLFLSQKVVAKEMMQILSGTLGKGSALQIRQTTRGFGTLASNWLIAAAGFLFLLFVATTLFLVIKNSLNEIWHIKVKDKPGILFYLKLRTRSLGIILVAGLLFLGAIFLDGFEILAGDYIGTIFPNGGKFFKGISNEIVSAIAITIWFIILFRYLADGRPSWRVAFAGGCLTGVLFAAGKTLLGRHAARRCRRVIRTVRPADPDSSQLSRAAGSRRSPRQRQRAGKMDLAHLEPPNHRHAMGRHSWSRSDETERGHKSHSESDAH